MRGRLNNSLSVSLLVLIPRMGIKPGWDHDIMFNINFIGGQILINSRYSRTLKLKVDPQLYSRIVREAKKLEVDLPTYIRWCIQTGIYLDDLNLFVRSQSDEDLE
jgi:hypothetical protein